MCTDGTHANFSANWRPPPTAKWATTQPTRARSTAVTAAATQRGHVGRSLGNSAQIAAPNSGRNTMRVSTRQAPFNTRYSMNTTTAAAMSRW